MKSDLKGFCMFLLLFLHNQNIQKLVFFFLPPSPYLFQFAGFRLHRPPPLPRSMQLLWWMRILQVLWSPWRCLLAGKNYETRWTWPDESWKVLQKTLLTWQNHWGFCAFGRSFVISRVIWTSRLQDSHEQKQEQTASLLWVVVSIIFFFTPLGKIPVLTILKQTFRNNHWTCVLNSDDPKRAWLCLLPNSGGSSW